MSAKQITVPLEVYVRLQELASLAAYSYRDNQGSEENSASDKPWDLLSQDGASLLDENGALKPEAAELYFTLLPLIAQEFMEQQQALVDAYRQAPKPAAARAKIRPSNQRLIPLTEVPPRRRIYGVLPGVMDYMMRHGLTYELLLDIIESPASTVVQESAQENRYGREVTLYTHEEEGYQVVLNPLTAEVLALRPLQALAGGYQLSPDAQAQLKALGLTGEYIARILDEAEDRRPIPGSSRTVYSLNGYQVEFSHSDQQVIRISRGTAPSRNPFESQPRMSGTKRQRGRKIPHDVDAFVQLLQEHGFTITMGGKHYDIRHEKLAPGQKAVTSVTPSDSQRWHLNSARQIRNTFGIDLRYADPRDSVRGIVRGPGRSIQNADNQSAEKQDAEKTVEKESK